MKKSESNQTDENEQRTEDNNAKWSEATYMYKCFRESVASALVSIKSNVKERFNRREENEVKVLNGDIILILFLDITPEVQKRLYYAVRRLKEKYPGEEFIVIKFSH